MIIGIDGNEANADQRVGIGQYAFSVLFHLNRLFIQDQKNRKPQDVKFKIYLKQRPKSDFPVETNGWNYSVFGPKRAWTQIALPIRLYTEKEKINVFFSPSHYAPRFCPVPRFISIMDLSYIYFPEMFDQKDLYQLVHWTNYSVHKAEKIFTISKFSKKTIVDYYKINPEDVIVTYPGYNEKIYKVEDIEANKAKSILKKKFQISSPFILFVGTLQPRKNLVGLIEAFKRVVSKKYLKNIQLVIVGKKGWLYDEIFSKVKECAVEEKVIFTNYISDPMLAMLYNNALCTILPSFYEGFGIPLIEAMACGCPVIASNITSIPEILADAGMTFDPHNIKDLSNLIIRVCTDESLRKQMKTKGLQRAQLFRWSTCAEKTFEIFKKYDTAVQ